MRFLLHPKALGVSENEFVFGKSKLTTGTGMNRTNRRKIAGLVGIAEAPKFFRRPLVDFGLAS
jgi:hypothetical protein